MSEKDFRDETYGPAFWAAIGFGSAMLAAQLALHAMRTMQRVGGPAQFMMRGPFGAASWMLGGARETDPPRPFAATAMTRAPEVEDAELVAPDPTPLIPTPAEVVADFAKITEPLVSATRRSISAVSETLTDVTPAAPASEDADQPALAEIMEPETAEDGEGKGGQAAVSSDRPSALSAPRGPADDLKRIRGVGPKLETVLNELGYFHFDQIAGWDPKELSAVDESLGGFFGRATRDGWITQAKELVQGGTLH